MQQLAKNQQVMENQLEEERKKRKKVEEECQVINPPFELIVYFN